MRSLLLFSLKPKQLFISMRTYIVCTPAVWNVIMINDTCGKLNERCLHDCKYRFYGELCDRGNGYPWLYILIVTSLTHSFLRRQVLEASTRDFNLARSAATRSAVSLVRPLLFRSFWAVLLQVSFGRHLFLFPWWYQS